MQFAQFLQQIVEVTILHFFFLLNYSVQNGIFKLQYLPAWQDLFPAGKPVSRGPHGNVKWKP